MQKSILIIEDDVFISDIYKRALVNASYVIETAVDGQDALDKIKIKPYDLILLDIMLPKITGVDVLKNIRNTENPAKNTPVLLITNLGENNIIEKTMQIGAQGYLLKAQLTPSELVGKINEFFQNQKPQ